MLSKNFVCRGKNGTNKSGEFQKLLFGILIFIVIHGNEVVSYELNLSNDGPAILNSNLTIEAYLEGGRSGELYSFELEDEHGAKIVSLESGENTSFIINMNSETYKPDTYKWTVKVYKKIIIVPLWEVIAQSKTVFKITETVNGNISVSNMIGRFVAVNSSLNFTFDIHDPSGYFEKAELDYAWTIGEKTFFSSWAIFNVTSEGALDAHVYIHARVPTSEGQHTDVWGFYDKNIEALRRVENINITGNVYLPKGDVVAIDINCNGSGPFQYCWRIFPPDVPSTIIQNMSCDPVIYTQCYFHFQRYFPLAGKYSIGTLIGNRLGQIRRTIDLEVYDVSTRPQLSTIIVPISCTLIGMLIIVVGMTYHIHQRKSYVVEVADFDFQQPVILSEKTFMERVKESFKVAYHNCKNDTVDMIDDDEECLGTEPNLEKRASGSSGHSNLLPGFYGSTA